MLWRGPIVFAAEWADNAGKRARNLLLPDESALTSQFRPDLLNGVQTITGKAYGLTRDAQGKVLKTEQTLVAIPYSTWANRGRGEMLVWIPRTDAVARPAPYPTISMLSVATTSGRKNPWGVHDGDDPAASNDPSAYFDWWPTKGTTEWIEYAFPAAAAVSSSRYSRRPGGSGPASWRPC